MSNLIRFIRDISSHQLTVIRDDGLYRHLRFARPNTNAYQFDIVTWPGYLTVTGDMGTWTFSRIADMFNFFTADHDGKRESFQINPGYWSEKFESGAGCRHTDSPCYEFDETALIKALDEWHTEWLSGSGADEDESDKAEVAEKIISLTWESFSNANQAYAAVDAADLPDFDMSYVFEGLSMHRYTFHYLWICYAIVWGIERYRNKKLALNAMDKFFACQPVKGAINEQ
ncbi:hypothetical protein [Erwinia pyrifoliae]|uniref:hypothetical protein n=1 Tax=Erwinia pyrifoliae TaxID=79967 RepID=UPI00223ACDF3|nr:hypothetical protein [Erwinia pyrifoliae]MCT2385142.1 hypothetical protein [Erwinia pyrifoliae]MCU8585634.1 hypothetical protein [Erwinia pyrifoliae]